MSDRAPGIEVGEETVPNQKRTKRRSQPQSRPSWGKTRSQKYPLEAAGTRKREIAGEGSEKQKPGRVITDSGGEKEKIKGGGKRNSTEYICADVKRTTTRRATRICGNVTLHREASSR